MLEKWPFPLKQLNSVGTTISHCDAHNLLPVPVPTIQGLKFDFVRLFVVYFVFILAELVPGLSL